MAGARTAISRRWRIEPIVHRSRDRHLEATGKNWPIDVLLHPLHSFDAALPSCSCHIVAPTCRALKRRVPIRQRPGPLAALLPILSQGRAEPARPDGHGCLATAPLTRRALLAYGPCLSDLLGRPKNSLQSFVEHFRRQDKATTAPTSAARYERPARVPTDLALPPDGRSIATTFMVYKRGRQPLSVLTAAPTGRKSASVPRTTRDRHPLSDVAGFVSRLLVPVQADRPSAAGIPDVPSRWVLCG